MLNKKAIAAFAAGATLLSGMAFAAPAFVSAPAFAETHAAGKTDAQIKEAYDKAVTDYNDALAAKQAADSAKSTAYAVEGVSGVLTSDLKKQTADGNTTANYTITEGNDGVVTKVEAKQGGSVDVATACTTYIAKVADAKKANDTLAEKKTARDTAETAWENTNTYKQPGALSKLADPKTKVDEAKKAVDKAFPAYVKAYNDYKAALKDQKKAKRAVDDLKDSTPEDQQGTNAYLLKLKSLNKAYAKAQSATKKALEAVKKAANAFTGFNAATNAAYTIDFAQAESAVKVYRDALAKYREAYDAAKALGSDMSSYADPADLELDADDYSVALANASAGEEGKGGEGEGGSGEHHDKNKGKITPEEAKALAEFAVKYVKDAKSDPKTVKALAAALAKVTAAKKAKDAKALVSALKELKALVDPLMKKAPAKDTGKALESIFGSDVLYTKYKGLAVDLIKLGVTNIGAYDGLLNQLEFGLSRFGWDNVIKNFPEHGPKNNCDFLAWLRRHLTKAVAHYGHVEAAVKDVQAELNEDMKDAQARHDWDAVKVIDQKIALANGLREVAHHNLTRAKALLDSANDHARDLSCDTAAKEVRAAMDKEPNSPFKKSGQKNNGQKPNGQNGQKPNGGAASHQLGKTGATVALVAVAASVLAGMGAALRKIRH